MGRIFGIGFLVLALWAGAEIYAEGVDGAFGGSLARFAPSGGPADTAQSGPLTQRAGRKVDRAFRDGERRYDAQLAE